MKKTIKVIAMLLTLVMALGSFAACGKGSDNGNGGNDTGSSDNGGAAAIKGETKSWGNITVFVPEGYDITGEEDDPDYVQVYLVSRPLQAFTICVVDSEEDALASIEITKEANEVNGGAGDVTIKAGGVNWNGYAYKSGSDDCFVFYGKVGDKWIYVGGGYQTYNIGLTLKVLGSIKIG